MEPGCDLGFGVVDQNPVIVVVRSVANTEGVRVILGEGLVFEVWELPPLLSECEYRSVYFLSRARAISSQRSTLSNESNANVETPDAPTNVNSPTVSSGECGETNKPDR